MHVVGNFHFYNLNITVILFVDIPIKDSVCQSKTMTVDCAEPTYISIQSANVECCNSCYGDPYKCTNVGDTKPDVQESDRHSLQLAINACDGKTNCKLGLETTSGGATNIYKDDTCPGNYKRANVAHICAG